MNDAFEQRNRMRHFARIVNTEPIDTPRFKFAQAILRYYANRLSCQRKLDADGWRNAPDGTLPPSERTKFCWRTFAKSTASACNPTRFAP